MANANQIKNLIKAYIDADVERFRTIVLQIAAYEAKLNHETFARELKTLADKIGKNSNNSFRLTMKNDNPLFKMQITADKLDDLIVSDEVYEGIERILKEYLNKNKLKQYGLLNRRKIMLEGSPGTGKTFTASVIANEINLPLYTIQMDKLVTKFMGETSVKLRQIFDTIERIPGVYFFDEFDAIGADRSLDNEVGEMRRILNSFLQFIEQDSSDSIIIVATNNHKLLDTALFRRFDDVLHYSLPIEKEIKRIYKHKFSGYQKDFIVTEKVINSSEGLSHAEIIKACDDAIKSSILNAEKIDEDKLIKIVNKKLKVYGK